LQVEIKLYETYLKNIWQLWDLLVDFSMPLDEIRMLDHFNGLDANGIEQGDRISGPNVEDGSGHTTNVCTDLDNALHILDFAQTLDSGFDRLAMRFDKVKLLLIPGNLLGIPMSIDLLQIVLSNETQNGNRICFIIQGLKVVRRKLALSRTEAKFLEI
jgi:hypothetical protein